MKLSIRWKLLGSYLLLLLVMGGVLFAYLNRTLEQQLVDGVRTNLLREARLTALMVSREIRDAATDAHPVAVQIAERIHARVTFVTATGKVVGDSDVAGTDLPVLENHRERPEIREALQGDSGSATRYSTTLRTRMLYVAVPATAASGETLVVRLALPLSAVEQARVSLHQSLALSFILAALLAVGLSLLLTQLSSRILRALSEGAQRFGAGDFRRRVPAVSNDELGDLARVLNTMADRLEQQMGSLAAERNRLDAILRGMGEGLLVTDAAGTVTLVNPAFKRLLDLSGEPAGLPLADVCRHPQLIETFRRVQETRSEQIAEMTVPRPVELALLTHWVPLVEGGVTVGVVAVFHDISDLKRLERVRRDFVANVSHELRTPVTVIRGYAETLAGGSTDPAIVARFAAIIQSHAERLANLIGDLLTLSELEAKGSALTLRPHPLPELVGHCCQLLAPQAEEKAIALDCSLIPALAVLADRQRLEQVLVNLLDNAVKYTPAGGRITVTAGEEGGLVRVQVRDTGPGIPLHEQARIFERFYRVDAGRSRDQGGTGLGLAIVKHIVQLHGGTVGVESTPGQGTCFTFTLRRG
ncbi:MAG: HAMP domain-containing protein [Deltaproteobacteria bacterium]|nr:MAG: HAMP domain-containing protein [Deltaproteobacteria bacterium]